MAAKCRLCGQERELLNSHIIPRFAFVWIKKTSASPFLRGAKNPDERIQDYHEELLCRDCEQSFSDYEREFANRIFHPYMDDESDTFEYGPWLKRFVISVSWRILVSDQTDLNDLNQNHAENLREVRDIWGKILSGELNTSADIYDHHIFFMGDIKEADQPDMVPDNWEFYIERGLDATPVHGPRTTALYFKLPNLLFISCVQPPSDPSLRDTKVKERGKIGPPQEMGPRWGTFLINRARKASKRKASEEEQEKIKTRIESNPEKALDSGSFEAHAKRMERQIENHDPRNYLDRECPVCFTEHRIVEFLPKRPLARLEIERLNTRNEFAKGVYLEGQLEKEGISSDISPTFVLSRISKTRIVTLYENEGWIIEREIEHPDDGDPQEIGEMIWEGHRESIVEWAMEQKRSNEDN